MDRSNGKHSQRSAEHSRRSQKQAAALGFEPVDYLSCLYDRGEAQVPLANGEVIALRRVGLGRHFQLQALGQEIKDVPLDERVAVLRAWLKAAGVDNPGALALSDLPAVVRAVKAINAPRGQLAWTAHSSTPDNEPEQVKPTDYPGRQLARIVDMLARHYGWSLSEIMELPPELALAHAQECVLADRRQREWQHYLSDIAWEYDKGSHMSRYKPLSPLPWEMAPVRRSYEPVPEWVKEKYYPKGVIIDPAEGGVQSVAEGRKEWEAAGPRE